jgi:cytochrome c
VQDVLDRARAIDVRLSVIRTEEEEPAHTAGRMASALLVFLMTAGAAACSRDMQEQTSYQAQEAPRLHSPEGSVPRSSRKLRPVGRGGPEAAAAGASLFRINCLHCHGEQGQGDGPVAPFLKESPANLKNEEVRGMSLEDIYRVVTAGKDMMPSFRGELSAEERWQLAQYVSSLSHAATSPGRTGKPQ